MNRISFGIALAVAFGATAAPAIADDYQAAYYDNYRGAYVTNPSTYDDYRGTYWYSKYFGSSSLPYQPRDERAGLQTGSIQIRAFDQGYYNAHHLRLARDHTQVYALAREAYFDREVAIVVDAKTGDIIDVVILPH